MGRPLPVLPGVTGAYEMGQPPLQAPPMEAHVGNEGSPEPVRRPVPAASEPPAGRALALDGIPEAGSRAPARAQTYGYLTVAAHRDHQAVTGEYLRVLLDGVDVTDLVCVADDWRGYVLSYARLPGFDRGYFQDPEPGYEGARQRVRTDGEVVIRPGERSPFVPMQPSVTVVHHTTGQGGMVVVGDGGLQEAAWMLGDDDAPPPDLVSHDQDGFTLNFSTSPQSSAGWRHLLVLLARHWWQALRYAAENLKQGWTAAWEDWRDGEQ